MCSEEDSQKWLKLTKDDTETLRNIVEGNQLQEDVGGQSYWHRFTIIGGAALNKEEVLKLIIAHVHPALLVPVNYQIDGQDSFFIASKGCRDAILMLCKNELTFAHPRLGKRVNLEIILNYKPLTKEDVKVSARVEAVNSSRFRTLTCTLDLTAYHKDPRLGDDVFLPLFVPTSVHFVLSCSPELLSMMKTLILAENDIHSLEGLELNPQKQPKNLDLRRNQLDWKGFSNIPPGLKVMKLWLDDNPLCNDFLNQREYVAAVRSVLPSMTRLDGLLLVDLMSELPNVVDSVYWSPDGVSKLLAEQFVKHYIVLMESPPEERGSLERVYRQTAVFSLTLSISGIASSRVLPMKSLDRNFLKITDYNKLYTQLKRGPEEIMSTLGTLPDFEFDKSTIKIDVPYFVKNRCILIVVSGLLHTQGDLGLPSYFSFQRSFFLEPLRSNPDEWKISNDLFTLTSTSPPNVIQILNTLQMELGPGKSDWSLKPLVRSEETERDLVKQFRDLTSMDTIWCKKFLEDAGWDLETALQAFTDQYKIQQIPAEAFLD